MDLFPLRVVTSSLAGTTLRGLLEETFLPLWYKPKPDASGEQSLELLEPDNKKDKEKSHHLLRMCLSSFLEMGSCKFPDGY